MGVKEKLTGKGGKRPAKAVKQPQLNALEDLDYALYVLNRTQQMLADEATRSDNPEMFQKARIISIENCLPDVIQAFDRLNTLLRTKRPGGAYPNRYRKLAFDIMTDHYIDSRGLMKAVDLVQAVLDQLPKGTPISDADGREVFSQRLARDVRKSFIEAITVNFDDLN